MTNEAFIVKNRGADIRSLAFGKAPVGVDLRYCLQQIEGWQLSRHKIPTWAQTEGIIFPPRVSLEQCSSEQTARYKQELVLRLLPENRQRMVDLTGGLGVDFSFLGQIFNEAIYAECDKSLCDMARHNLPLLGMKNVQVHNTTSDKIVDEMGGFDLIFVDPSRRDSSGRKVIALADCSPDIEAMSGRLKEQARVVLVKLSPMLDITEALLRLENVSEVHTVSVDGECKELLLVLNFQANTDIRYFCVNLAKHRQTFTTSLRNATPMISDQPSRFLYEPNASILKAGVQDSLCHVFSIEKLHPFSHLYTSPHFIEDFPGRVFLVDDWSRFSKHDLKRLLFGIEQGNLTVRNFPSSVADLRKRLKLREGGEWYFFATTLADGSHALIRCKPL